VLGGTCRMEWPAIPMWTERGTRLQVSSGPHETVRRRSRYQHVFAEASEIQYIPILVGAKLDL
jgi:hypothetical protein